MLRRVGSRITARVVADEPYAAHAGEVTVLKRPLGVAPRGHDDDPIERPRLVDARACFDALDLGDAWANRDDLVAARDQTAEELPRRTVGRDRHADERQPVAQLNASRSGATAILQI